MVLVHVVSAQEATQRRRDFELYDRWRHLIFGATSSGDPCGEGSSDADCDLRHLIAVLGEEVVGGCRLNPRPRCAAMARCHELAEARNASQLPYVDWTGLFVVPAHRRGLRPRSVLGALYCGVMEHCLSLGADRVGGMVATFWLDFLTAVGWRLDILGLPRMHAGATHVPLLVHVDEAALVKVRAVTGFTQPVLTCGDGGGSLGFVDIDLTGCTARQSGAVTGPARRARSTSH